MSVPQISASDFNNSFSAMATLKPLAAEGKGNVAVILPDTVSSARYTEFDAPYLTKSLQLAGLKSSQFTVQNAQGSDATELSDAQTAITKGASVLIMDPLDSTVGASIEKYASAHGAAVIDYDRLTLGGSRKYYVSFNNVKVGNLLGQGLVSCISAWKVKNPNVLVMYGDPTDNNATLFGDGYNAVLNPLFKSGKYKQVGKAAGTWTRPPRRVSSSSSSPLTPASTRCSRPTTRTPRRSSPTCSARASRPRPSRSPGRTRPWSDCRTSWPATSAARSTSRSTWRPRPPPRSRCTSGPGPPCRRR